MSKAERPVSSPVPRAPKLAVAPFEGFDRAANLGVPQEITDDQLSGFTEGELKVLLSVVRATNGGQREGIALSVRVLCRGALPDILPGRGTGLSPRTVQAACAALEAAGYLRITRRVAPDGSGMPSLFSLPLLTPGIASAADKHPSRFPGYMSGKRARLPLLVIDRLLAELSGAELKVLLYVLRHTFCLGVADEVMPMARLVENSGLSLRHTRLAVAGLATRGLIVVQHRQDAERGKLPSRFGVRVLGETVPFSPPPTGMPVRVRAEEATADAARPVWLVPEPAPARPLPAPAPIADQPSAKPSIQAPALQVVPQQRANSPADGDRPAAQPLAVRPPAPMGAAPSTEAHGGTGDDPLPNGLPASLPSTGRPAAASRVIPESVLRDNHPAWSAAKRLLAERLPHHIFMEWVAPAVSVSGEGPELLIAVANESLRWQLESKLAGRIRAALDDAGYPNLRYRYLNFTGVIPNDDQQR